MAIKLTATNTNPDGAAFAMSFTKEREGSLDPLRLKCTKGTWALDDGIAAKTSKMRKPSKAQERKQQIVEAIEKGESQAEIVRRFKTSFRTVNKIKKETTNDHTSTDV